MTGNYAKAIADFEKAISIDPFYSFAYDNLGRAYYFKGDYIMARVSWEKAIEIAPNLTEVQEFLNELKQRGY
jgi:tetratricopeptide (TPR) repeat protein